MKVYATKVIKNNLDELNNLKKTINNFSDVIKLKNKLTNNIESSINMTKELINILKDYNFISITKEEFKGFKTLLEQELNKINQIDKDNIEIANTIINNILNYNVFGGTLYDNLFYIEKNDILTDYAYMNKDFYYEEIENLNDFDAQRILNAININKPYNIFSPRCGDGSSLLKLKKDDKAITYGLEYRNVYSQAKNFLNRIIKGDLNGSRISNNCFDMLYMVPKVSWFAEEGPTGNLIEKKEKYAVRNTIKYLKDNGILICALPKTRLTNDMAFLFSKLLKNVSILNKSNKNDYIYIIGQKQITKDPKEDVYVKLKQMKDIDVINEYNLPSSGIIEPELFRGSMLDEEALADIVLKDNLLNDFLESQNIFNDEENMKPLLPFNIGQIGLVLTSGCLDGVIEESDGQYHAIKGMVTKVKHSNVSSDNNTEIDIETISNKVQINLITPDGKFIELA